MSTGKPEVVQPDDDREIPEILDRFVKKFKSATKGDVERYSAESLEWWRRRLSKDASISRTRLIRDYGDYNRRTGNETMLIGRLYYFQYEAKEAGDKELGVYDQFPMVFFFNRTKNKEGQRVLWGLNLHYCTPQQRAVLYTQLMKLKSKRGWTEKTKLRITWQLIKSVAKHNLYTKAVHAYRVDRLQSKLIEIDPREWEIAVFLQLQKWAAIKNDKVTQSYVQNKLRRRK